MPFQSFENEEPSHSRHSSAARLTEREMEDVIALWQQEQDAGLSERPRAEDVAEGLNVPVSEVERLLQVVRAQRAEEEKRLAKEQAKLETETQRVRDEQEMLAGLQRQRVQVRRRIGQTRQSKPSTGVGTDAVVTGIAALIVSVLFAAWTLIAITLLFAPTIDFGAKFFFWGVEVFLLPWVWSLWRRAWRGFRDWLALRRADPPK